MFRYLVYIAVLALGFQSAAAAPHFKRVITVIFENGDYDPALAQPYFHELAARGALLANFSAERHPSQPNYIALTSGDTHGVWLDFNVDLDVAHVGDLLEAKGLGWKVYAEDYPGGCFLGGDSGRYARKHVPFISYVNVQNNPARCARIVDEKGFAADWAASALPVYTLYVPNLDNDGHDTGIDYAGQWFEKKFGPLLNNPALMKDTLVVVTFDESDGYFGNHIYTVLLGDMVKPGFVSEKAYNHYSLLRMVEEELGLGSLGEEDADASIINDVWK